MNNFYRNLIIILSLTVFTLNVQGQEEDYGSKNKKKTEQDGTFEYNSSGDNGKKWDWTKARIGGGLGLAFQNGAFMFDASPTFGYRINKVVEAGAGFKIYYYKDDAVPLIDGNKIVGFVSYKDIIYGPIFYTRLFVWEGVFAMAQYEMTNKEPYYLDNEKDRINVHELLIGGGYSTSMGSVGHLNISLLYNVLDNKESIYQFGTFGSFPLFLNISVGFGIGGRR